MFTMRPSMNAPEMWCPKCSGILKPVADRPGLLECVSCKNLFSPQTSAGQVVENIVTVIGKALLVLAGVAVIAGALLFAGCLFLATNLGR